MSNLTRYNRNGLFSYDPFHVARELFASEPWGLMRGSSSDQAASFSPRFNVVETEDAYVLTADMPGVKDEDLDISLTGNKLVVHGSRGTEAQKEGESYHLYERTFGTFTRSFLLPDEANGENVDADLDAGVLTIKVGKRSQAMPRKISVKKAE